MLQLKTSGPQGWFPMKISNAWCIIKIKCNKCSAVKKQEKQQNSDGKTGIFMPKTVFDKIDFFFMVVNCNSKTNHC